MKNNGEVTYYRNKTKRRAQPTLVPHVVGLLKTTVPIDGDLNQPFYDKTIADDTNPNYWSAELKKVFAEAGIESVKTDIRDREPHSHMLRIRSPSINSVTDCKVWANAGDLSL